jgi:uncharacterized cupin superfamily protein
MRTALALSIVGAALLSGRLAPRATAALMSQDPSRFSYTRIYCTPDAETHFENLTVELSKTNVVPPAAPLYAGGNRAVSTATFIGADAHWGTHDAESHLNHPAPAAQFVVVLKGVLLVTTTDGGTRRFSPGDVVRVEDTAPCKGHVTAFGDNPGLLMFVR